VHRMCCSAPVLAVFFSCIYIHIRTEKECGKSIECEVKIAFISAHTRNNVDIDVRKYYVRVLVEEKLIKLMSCGTKELTADALTKSLMCKMFINNRKS